MWKISYLYQKQHRVDTMPLFYTIEHTVTLTMLILTFITCACIIHAHVWFLHQVKISTSVLNQKITKNVHLCLSIFLNFPISHLISSLIEHAVTQTMSCVYNSTSVGCRCLMKNFQGDHLQIPQKSCALHFANCVQSLGLEGFISFLWPFLFHIICPKSFAQGLVHYLGVDNLNAAAHVAINGPKRRGKIPLTPFKIARKVTKR